jgi:hypothetical protein
VDNTLFLRSDLEDNIGENLRRYSALLNKHQLKRDEKLDPKYVKSTPYIKPIKLFKGDEHGEYNDRELYQVHRPQNLHTRNRDM